MSKTTRSKIVLAYVSLLLTVLSSIADSTPITDVPPQFTQEPEDTFVFERDASGQPTTLTISCGTSGDPTPTVTWFRSGVEVDSSLVLESGTLSIPNITEGESASRDGIPYYCTATNSLGTIRSKTVQVFYAFFDGIAAPNTSVNINVTAGLDVALLCDIPSACPPPVIEWWDDNGLIPDVPDMDVRYVNGGQYLVIRELTAEQISRTYRCRVTNAVVHDTVTSNGDYTLNDLGGNFPDDNLIIYKELETEVTAFVGDPVEVSFVSAIRSTVFVYEYRLDDGVGGITSQRPYGEIEEVMFPDGGGFTSTIELTVVSDVDPPVVRRANLTVYEAAVIDEHSPDDLDQFVGDSVTLSCTVAGTPAPTVEWYFNGEVLASGNGLTINGGTIDIPSPTTDHSGMYQCFVSNPASEVCESIALQVRRPDPPVITGISPPDNDRCRDIPTYVRPAGDTLTLSVDVTADPCPEVVWMVDGRTLAEVEESAGCNMTFYTTNSCSDFPDPATGSYTFTIAINNITDCTAGRYNITLSNRAGTVTSDPVFVTPEVPVDVVGVQIQNAMCLQDNMNATISCEVEGYPYPGITFGKDNMPLLESERVTLNDCMMVVLTSIEMSDEGRYSCTAQNVANGETTTLTSDAADLEYCTLPQVVSLVPPSSPIDEGEDIEFTCSVSGTPPPEFTWLKDGVVLSDDDRITISSNVLDRESQLEITSVITDDSGAYTCIATNPADEARRVTSVEIIASSNPVLSTEAIIGIAAGAGGGLLLILVVIVLLCCVYTCAKRSGEYVVPGGAKHVNYNNNQDFTDGRGNVDRDSDEEDVGEPEAFDPQYQSLPVVRPAAPPQYKPTPHYPHGAPLTADDIEMTKVPPPDTDSTHFSEFMGAPYGRQDNGSMPPGGVAPGYRPSVDDFLSEDAQFV